MTQEQRGDDGSILYADGDAVMSIGPWHRWFAWRPVWTMQTGWLWLRMIERSFSQRSSPRATTTIAKHRLRAEQEGAAA